MQTPLLQPTSTYINHQFHPMSPASVISAHRHNGWRELGGSCDDTTRRHFLWAAAVSWICRIHSNSGIQSWFMLMLQWPRECWTRFARTQSPILLSHLEGWDKGHHYWCPIICGVEVIIFGQQRAYSRNFSTWLEFSLEHKRPAAQSLYMHHHLEYDTLHAWWLTDKRIE